MSQAITDGSVRQVWKVSFPLMLAIFSSMGMIFIDRMFLALYSPSAIAAAVSGGTLAWGFTFGFEQLTSITTVFVSQHNGAKRFDKIGAPVWQMLWLGVISVVPFLVLGPLLGPLFFKGSPLEQEQVLYFKWMMGISPFFALTGALRGFFIGRGESKVIIQLALVCNLINVVLDPILIFGWGPIPSLGIPGACMATGIGMAVQAVLGFWIFMRQKNREAFGTAKWGFRPSIMWDMVRIGAPEAIALGLEVGAWGYFYCLVSDLGAIYILVASCAQTILMLFLWFGIGLEHGVSSVGGNLIGAGQKIRLPEVLKSGLRLNLGFAVALAAAMWLFGGYLVDLLIQKPQEVEVGPMSADELVQAAKYALQALGVVWVYIILENMRMVVHGLLRSAGDTLFILIAGTLNFWLFLLGPTYVLMFQWRSSVPTMFYIWFGYSVIALGISSLRFWWGSWLNKEVIRTS